ncbi:MAG: hypothetical protein WBP94_16885 [Rhodomicrobiaceae bacterium]
MALGIDRRLVASVAPLTPAPLFKASIEGIGGLEDTFVFQKSSWLPSRLLKKSLAVGRRS